MSDFVKATIVSLLFASAFSSQASENNITVQASVDPTVSLTLADGSALPSTVTMQYQAGVGLVAYKNNVKLWSNDATKNLQINLGAIPKLTDQNGANPIELAVSLNGVALSTTASTFTAASLFPGGVNTNGSSPLPLVISQKTFAPVTTAGNYSGLVNIVVTQATSGN
ncbi:MULTISPECIES: CS1 type fimbrial major subunit [Enterobacter]